MSPPVASTILHHPIVREVTEDTPPDLLEGTMDLLVILPSKKNIRMTVNRRTPIMDLLIQVTTANKINPGGHIVQVRNEIGRELQYKPSTPIGALDTTTIEIVPKNQVNDYIIVKKQSAKVPSQPFEHTFRLQVHLPRNQLYVMRVGPKTLLQDILEEVCQEKNLDIGRYEIRHPVNLDEKLSLTNRLGDYGIQQVRVMSKNSRISSSVSSADIMALQEKENGRSNPGCLDSVFKYSRSSVGDSSVSSESAASARGTSPSRSDDSRSISPPIIGILPSKIKLKSSLSSASSSASNTPLTAMLKKSVSSNPLPTTLLGSGDLNFKSKKRAPAPPVALHKPLSQSYSQPTSSMEVIKPVVPRKKAPIPGLVHQTSFPAPPTNHSRHSSASDSSGYHEASASSILSEQQQEMIRNDRSISAARKFATGSLSSLTNNPTTAAFTMSGGSTSTTNLTSGLSISSTSLASSVGSRNKRKAPKPPVAPSLQAPYELEEDSPVPPPVQSTLASSHTLSEGEQRKALEVQVEVHSSRKKEVIGVADTAETNEPYDETETSSGESTIRQNQKRSPSPDTQSKSETLKYGTVVPGTLSSTTSTSSSMSSGSTLTKSGGSNNGSRSSMTNSSSSLSGSPLPIEESQSRRSPVVPSTPDMSLPSSHSPSNTSAQAISPALSSSATPNPQPRTQPRTKLPESILPQPKPKPRPGRSKDELEPITLERSHPPEASLPLPPVPPRIPERHASRSTISSNSSFDEPENRNPLTRFGIKVLPHNASEDLKGRLSQIESNKAIAFNSKSHHRDDEKHEKSQSVAIASQHTLSQDMTPLLQIRTEAVVTAISGTLEAAKTVPTKSVAAIAIPLPPSRRRTLPPVFDSGSVQSLVRLNDSFKSESNSQIHSIRTTSADIDHKNDEDSDDLEENLEMFENKSKGESGILKRLKSTSVFSSTTTNTSKSSEDSKSDESETEDEKHTLILSKMKQIPTMKTTSSKPILRRGVSTSEILNEKDHDTKNEFPIVSTSQTLKRSQNSTNSKILSENSESLTRWKNSEMLELNTESPKDKVTQSNFQLTTYSQSSVQKPLLTKTNQPPLSSMPNDKKLDSTFPKTLIKKIRRKKLHSALDIKQRGAGENDKHEDASSGSEASYADSGLPATATVTPSPVSLDHDDIGGRDDDHHSDKSLNSSRRSSMRSASSDHSECWRELLASNIGEQKTEKALESVMSELKLKEVENVDEEKDKSSAGAMTLSANFFAAAPPGNWIDPNKEDEAKEEIKGMKEVSHPHLESSITAIVKKSEINTEQPKPKSESDVNSSLPSSDDEPDLIQLKKKRDSRSSQSNSIGSISQKRNLSNSESFSHNSEFDGKKQRRTGQSGTGNRWVETKSNLYTSSSEDEDDGRRYTAIPEKGKHKSTSMQNLAKEKTKKESGPLRKPKQENEETKIEKSTSLLEIQNLPGASPTDTLEDPQLRQKFQVELEQQFEQWKEEFIQRHIGSSPKSSIDSSVEQKANQIEKTVNKSNSLSSRSSSSVSLDVSEGETEEFDPEKPQAVYSVGTRLPVEAKHETTLLEASNKVEEQNTLNMNASEAVKRREKKVETPPSFRYSGPPTIQMGTWGERPRSSIAVKEDNDYIMGKGQQDFRVNIESKPHGNSIASRIHNFAGTSIVPSPAQTSTLPKRGPSSNTSRWSNVEVKSFEPINTNASRASATPTWKQRVDEPEKFGKETPSPVVITSSQSPVEKIETSRINLELPRSISHKPSFTISSASSTLERPIGKRTPSPLFTSITPAQGASTTSVAPLKLSQVKKIEKEVLIEHKVPSSGTNKIQVSSSTTNGITNTNNSANLTMADKKRVYEGLKTENSTREPNPINPPSSSVQLKQYSRKPVKEVVMNDVVDSPATTVNNRNSFPATNFSASANFASADSPSSTMQDKKSYFQGVKPSSPTREAPLPAVNMKSSIATIGRIFEQKNQNSYPLKKSTSTSSLTSESSSSTISSFSPSPNTTIPKKSNGEFIGMTSQSDLMVRRVIKGNSLAKIETLRQTPSPSPTVSSGVPDKSQGGTVRISTSATTSASNIQNYGNKAIITIGEENTKGNFYRQQLKVSGGDGGHSVKISINAPSGETASQSAISGNTTSQKPSKIVINSTKPNNQSSITTQQPLTNQAGKPIILDEAKKAPTKSKIQEMQTLLSQQKLNFVPPAPPLPMQKVQQSTPTRPISNGIRKDSTSDSSESGSTRSSISGSTPETPSNPSDPRAGILSAIKNSGGNFGLKKTRSSMLLN